MIVSQCSDIGLDNLNLTVAQTQIWRFEPPGRDLQVRAAGPRRLGHRRWAVTPSP